MYRAVIAILAVVIIIGAALLGGCNQPGSPMTNLTTVTPTSVPSYHPYGLTGHVYLDGHAISGARVEAIPMNGTERINTETHDGGAYTLNINADTMYNLTASWQGLRHTVRPVCLPGDTNTYDINITSVPTSTIEGSGYTVGPGGRPELFERYDHKRASGFRMGVTSVGGNTSITTVTDDNGNYTLVVEPNVLYNMRGGPAGQNPPDYIISIAVFSYRNDGRILVGNYGNIVVGPNETVLVDYVIYVP